MAQHFNPRSPHGERHEQYATVSYVDDFNPRSPHGERPCQVRDLLENLVISIQAPRTGSDIIIDAFKPPRFTFQSTLPARGATWFERANAGSRKISIHAPRTGSDVNLYLLKIASIISIHAPRTGSDMGRVGDSICAHDFNPRSPHGERPGKLLTAMIYTLRISIHAPRTGSDRPSASAHQERDLIFQSTLPARGATVHIVPR